MKKWSANSVKRRVKLVLYKVNKYNVYRLDGKVQKNERTLKEVILITSIFL